MLDIVVCGEREVLSVSSRERDFVCVVKGVCAQGSVGLLR